MELAIAIFIGLWMTVIVALADWKLKKDYQDVLKKNGEDER